MAQYHMRPMVFHLSDRCLVLKMALRPASLLSVLHKQEELEKYYVSGLLRALPNGICGHATLEDIQTIPTTNIASQRAWRSTEMSMPCIFLGMSGQPGEIKNYHQPTTLSSKMVAKWVLTMDGSEPIGLLKRETTPQNKQQKRGKDLVLGKRELKRNVKPSETMLEF